MQIQAETKWLSFLRQHFQMHGWDYSSLPWTYHLCLLMWITVAWFRIPLTYFCNWIGMTRHLVEYESSCLLVFAKKMKPNGAVAIDGITPNRIGNSSLEVAFVYNLILLLFYNSLSVVNNAIRSAKLYSNISIDKNDLNMTNACISISTSNRS